MKKYDDWNEIKKNISQKSSIYTKEGEIYYASLGENIGYEQNGKGDNFMRPILVYKKFGRDTIFAMPLSSKEKNGRFYFSFSFKDEQISVALLSQARLLDTRRLFSKIGRMKLNDFTMLKKKFNELIN
ncbi:MAG: type II toxin-antitoxin system PemK/MazF family toxin [Epsilonproteobacteria bacterium]|nr:MAG: type II toxin-antitoxin system PemK/MazF family toxin [Campylobacterota bacterium]